MIIDLDKKIVKSDFYYFLHDSDQLQFFSKIFVYVI